MNPGIYTLLLSTGDEVITTVRSFENAFLTVESPHRIVVDFKDGMLQFEFLPLIFSGNMGQPLRIYRKHIVAQTDPDPALAGLYKKQMEALDSEISTAALFQNALRDNK
jgi:hypothetical protein